MLHDQPCDPQGVEVCPSMRPQQETGRNSGGACNGQPSAKFAPDSGPADRSGHYGTAGPAGQDGAVFRQRYPARGSDNRGPDSDRERPPILASTLTRFSDRKRAGEKTSSGDNGRLRAIVGRQSPRTPGRIKSEPDGGEFP